MLGGLPTSRSPRDSDFVVVETFRVLSVWDVGLFARRDRIGRGGGAVVLGEKRVRWEECVQDTSTP